MTTSCLSLWTLSRTTLLVGVLAALATLALTSPAGPSSMLAPSGSVARSSSLFLGALPMAGLGTLISAFFFIVYRRAL